MSTEAAYNGLTHVCADPDCHVPGFVKTLSLRLATPDAGDASEAVMCDCHNPPQRLAAHDDYDASASASEPLDPDDDLARVCWLLDSGDPEWGWENLTDDQRDYHRKQAKMLAPVVAAREAKARAQAGEQIAQAIEAEGRKHPSHPCDCRGCSAYRHAARPAPEADDAFTLSRAEAVDLHWLIAVAIDTGLPRASMLNLALRLSDRLAVYTGDTSTTDMWRARTGKADPTAGEGCCGNDCGQCLAAPVPGAGDASEQAPNDRGCPSRCGWNEPCANPWHDRRTGASEPLSEDERDVLLVSAGKFEGDPSIPGLLIAVVRIVAAREAAAATKARAEVGEQIAQAIEADPGIRLGHNVSVVCSCLRCEVAHAAARIARSVTR